MSLENAILEHAAALREVAAAVKSMGHGTLGHGTLGMVVAIEKKADAYEAGATGEKDEIKDAEIKDAETEQAVQKVEEAAKEEQAEASELDYTKDVRPVLLAVNKKAGQPALKALLTQFGAATGDKLTADQYADVLVEANKILAA